MNTFNFVGKGKILIDGKEVEAEVRFVGIPKFDEQINKIITFDLVPQGEDQVLYETVLKPE